jgi:hypothetical protein
MFEDPQTHIFLELILTADAKPLYTEVREGVTIEYYTGPSGRKIPIIISDEYIPTGTAKGYLEQLGYAHLIPVLFP